MKIFNLMKLMS